MGVVFFFLCMRCARLGILNIFAFTWARGECMLGVYQYIFIATAHHYDDIRADSPEFP